MRFGLWEVILLTPGLPSLPLQSVFSGSGLGPDLRGRSPGFWADSCPSPPAEAPDGQGQGPQAAREHRKVGKEWRGPAEVRGGASWARGGLRRQGGGSDSPPGLRPQAEPHLHLQGEEAEPADRSPESRYRVGREGHGLVCTAMGSPADTRPPHPQHFRGWPLTSQAAAARPPARI